MCTQCVPCLNAAVDETDLAGSSLPTDISPKKASTKGL